MKNANNSKLPSVSVILPTYNRCMLLIQTLKKYLNQTYPQKLYNLIVIDDGSIDRTKKEVLRFKNQNLKTIKLSYYYQKNKGPAAARNLGIKNSKSDIIIIVNDDIEPINDFIKQHIKFHLQFPKQNYAVLGFTTWSPKISVTPYMRWLESRGPLFSYNSIKGIKASWGQTWTCNISYKRDFLIKHGLFDEDFPYAAWEDIELGYRLYQKGMKLRYNKKAVGYHNHATTLKSSIKKMKHQGISAVILGQKIHDLSCLPPLGKKNPGDIIDLVDRIVFNKLVLALARRIAFFCESKWQCHYLYEYLLLHYRVVARRNYLKSKNV